MGTHAPLDAQENFSLSVHSIYTINLVVGAAWCRASKLCTSSGVERCSAENAVITKVIQRKHWI